MPRLSNMIRRPIDARLQTPNQWERTARCRMTTQTSTLSLRLTWCGRADATPLELVEAAISRIELLNPVLNAVVTPLFDKARDQASSAALPRRAISWGPDGAEGLHLPFGR